jgi:putative ABC transport system permease protein
MFQNYFKTAWRSLQRNRTHTIINAIGLSLGLCSCLMVASVVVDDLSYDKQWKKSTQLYRILSITSMGNGIEETSSSSFAGLAPALQKNFPEVEAFSKIMGYDIHFKVNLNEASGVKTKAHRVDTGIWKMLDLKVLQGQPQKLIEGTRNIVISKKYRDKYFKNEEVIGKVIKDVPVYKDEATDYIITGVIDDLPENSHLRSDVLLIGNPTTEELSKKQYGSFYSNYVLLKEGANVKEFENKVNAWYASYVEQKNPYRFTMQPMQDIYLKSDFAGYQSVKGSMQNIYIFSAIAILLLLIACLNFINLSTSRLTAQLEQTAVRKILGASKMNLVKQSLTEIMFTFLISTFIALLVYYSLLKPLEQFLGHSISMTVFTSVLFAGGTCAAMAVVCLLTGLYPAFLLSNLNPVRAMKGEVAKQGQLGQNRLRKLLVITQFTISIVVITAMIVTRAQLNFIDKKDIGFNKNNLLVVQQVAWEGKAEAFKNKLLQNPLFESASFSNWIPSKGGGYMSKQVNHPQQTGQKVKVWYINGDASLASTLGWQLSKGRLLNPQRIADAPNADSMMNINFETFELQPRNALITKSTAAFMGIDNLDSLHKDLNINPVGIINDFHNESLREKIGPVVVTASQRPEYAGLLIRYMPGKQNEAARAVSKLWPEFFKSQLLEMDFVSELLDGQYEKEHKQHQLFTLFSMLTVLLACLGVLGLMMYTVRLRVKEIGIRKVLGASVYKIVFLLSKSLISPVFIAFAIAVPLAWFSMNYWLNDFAYKTQFKFWFFGLSGFIAAGIAVITIITQTIKAAMQNPVKSLRTE